MSLRIRRAFPRPLVFAGLYAVFLLCFIVTPLWNLLPGKILKTVFLGGSLGLAWLWAWWGCGFVGASVGGAGGADRVSGNGVSGAFRLRAPSAREIQGFLLVLIVTVITSFPALSASIAWRGDEDFHVAFTAHLAKLYRSHWPYLACLAIFWGAWSAFQEGRPDRVRVRTRVRIRVIAAGILMGILSAFAGRAAHLDIYYVLRYPIFLKYVTALPVFLYSGMPVDFLPELPYRLLPLLVGAGLAGLVFQRLRRHPILIRLSAAVAIGGLPLVRYYETLFYLEMPAVLSMAWVCFQAAPLLRADLKSLPGFSGWYALLLLGFMKETVIPFLAAFLCCRVLFRLQALRRDPEPLQSWAREAMVLFCVLVPLCLYLFYRSKFAAVRGYHPDFSNLADAQLLKRAALSWWDDFGPMPVISLAGAWLLARRGKWAALIFPCLSIAWTFLFHFLDDKAYVGYSRFNLFLLPGLLVLAWEALRFGVMRFPRITYLGLALMLAFDLLASPIHFDGSRRAGWGVYGAEVGEYSYPYREAMRWIHEHHPRDKVRLTGLNYPYPVGFYLPGNPAPDVVMIEKTSNETRTMDSLLAVASEEGCNAVLYHVLGDTIPTLSHPNGYGTRRVFRNQEHSLVLFTR